MRTSEAPPDAAPGAGAGALVLLISIVLPVVLPVFHFPKPTGPYAIGTVTYNWVDTGRPELFTTDPNAYRELMVQIPSIFHLNFIDTPYWLPISARLGITGPIDGQRGFDILNAYSLAFFDRCLKGQSSPLLAGPSQPYPEVNLETW